MDKKLYNFIVEREHHKYRKDYPEALNYLKSSADKDGYSEAFRAYRSNYIYDILEKVSTILNDDGVGVAITNLQELVPKSIAA